MTGKQLKNSILQLAIQGKLVPQDSHDEPASELLKRIRKEKEQLVKEGKLKKKDLESTPIAEEDKPFEIPETWEWCRLGEIGSWGAGATPSKGKPEFYSNGTIPWLRTGELNNGYVYDAEIKVSQLALNNCSLRMCSKGDVLIAMYGATIGKVAIAGIELTTNQACCACTPIIIFNEYLMWYLMASKQAFIELGEGGAQPNISREKIVAFPFAIPPLSEQHRIVAKIEELMPLVEEYDKAQSELDKLNESLPEQLKKSILQQAIMGKLVPQDPNDEPASELLKRIHKEKENLVKSGALKKKDLIITPISDDEKPFDIPESWEWVHLGDIFAHTNGKQLNRADTKGEYHDYITTSNLYWDRFDLKEIRQMLFTEEELMRCTATKGDLLVCEGGDIGRSAIWNEDYDICIQNHIHRVRAYLPLCTRYFLYLLMFNKAIGLIGGKGIGIQGFSAKALHNTLVALPPLSEQHRIVAKIEELFSIIIA